MELKYLNVFRPGMMRSRFNCTFMELKLSMRNMLIMKLKVLIVPLWN